MKNTNSKKISKLSIALYIIAGLFMVYTIYNMYHSYTYISSLISAGSINPSEQTTEIVNYFITSTSNYLFYAIIVFSAGYIINKLNVITENINSFNFHKSNAITENVTTLTNEESTLDEKLLIDDDNENIIK